jgi:hypothetical protein
VYHAYITYYGRTLPLKPSEIKGDPGPGMIIAWQLVLGNQLGRLWPSYANQLDDPVVARHMRFLQQACALRDRWPHFLSTGRMLRPPYVIGEIPNLTTHEFRRMDNTVTLPALMAGAWGAPDGSVGLVVANASDKTLSATLKLDRADLGWGEGPPIRQPVTVGGLDATLFELTPY